MKLRQTFTTQPRPPSRPTRDLTAQWLGLALILARYPSWLRGRRPEHCAMVLRIAQRLAQQERNR